MERDSVVIQLYRGIKGNVIAMNIMQEVQREFSRRVVRGWEDKVKEIFLKKTGDELTLQNIDRLVINKISGDPNEYYMIDGVLAVTVYPYEYDLEGRDKYCFTAVRKYQEH